MSEAEESRRERRSKRTGLRRGLVVGGGLLAVGALAFAGTGIASALTAGSGYRTALVERAAVGETVQTSGTIAAVSRVDLAFQAAGTVASVEVAPGDAVRAGQTLASLDREGLEDAVSEAEGALADAEQTLAEHTEAQSSGTTTESSAPTAAPAAVLPAAALVSAVWNGVAAVVGAVQTGGSDGSGASASTGVEAAAQRVVDAQQAMLDRHREVQETREATDGTIATADAVCAPFLSAVLSDPDGGAEGADEIAAGVDAGMTLEQAQQALADCQGAITAVRDGQAAVGAGQQEVQDLATALDAAVAELQQALAEAGSLSDDAGSDAGGSGGADPGGADPGGADPDGAANPGAAGNPGGAAGAGDARSESGASPETGGAGGGTGTASGGTVITAEQLLADQAAIDAAEAGLRLAEARLAFSALTSPIDGTVAAVEIAEGDSVAAGSSTAIITVLGAEGYVVETTVPLSDIARLAVHQGADVFVNASGETYPGEVSSVGLLDVSTTSTPAYTVIVALETGDDELLVGGSARATIRTATTEDALTVPTSAVHRDGGTATVNVLDGDEVSAIEVEVGALGSERTEILSGLEEGQSVVLADLSQEIVADDAESETSGLAGLGGSGSGATSLPGGGIPAGGFPGGRDLQQPAGGFGG